MQNTRYNFVTIDEVNWFYREAGLPEAPALLLLHGFPSSSIQYRYLLSALSDRWRLIAPDLPGFGLSTLSVQQPYKYSFRYIAEALSHFLTHLKVDPRALYLHDYGAQAGFHMLTSGAIHPAGIIIQNSEAYYHEGRTMAWKNAEALWHHPSKSNEDKLRNTLLDSSGIRNEFLEDLPQDIAARIDPVIINLAIGHFKEPAVIDLMLALHHDYKNNVAHYTAIQQYFQKYQPPALILWGCRDQYYTGEQAYAFTKDLPKAQIELLDGGHWLLESHPKETVALTEAFLNKLVL